MKVKKLKNNKTWAVFVLLLALMIGCENFSSPINSYYGENFFASDEALESFQNSKNYLDYKFVRKIVIKELSSTVFDDFEIDSFTLSEKPILIFDDNGILYKYEFLILSDGKSVGIVVANVAEDRGTAIAFILPFVRDLSNYPKESYLVAGESYPLEIKALKYLDVNLSSVKRSFTDEYYYGDLDLLEPEDMYDLEADSVDEIKKIYNDEIAKMKAEEKLYWKNLDKNKKSILETKDVVHRGEVEISRAGEPTKILSAYNSLALRGTRWGGPCVPGAMAWVYRGLYSSFAGKYIPIADGMYYKYDDLDYSDPVTKNIILSRSTTNDGKLYYYLCEEGKIFKYKNSSVTGNRYNNMIKYVTNNNYTTLYTAVRKTARNNIYNNNLPVLITKNYPAGYHCLVAFGVRTSGYNYQYLVTDNGYETYGNQYYWMTDCEFLLGGYMLRAK